MPTRLICSSMGLTVLLLVACVASHVAKRPATAPAPPTPPALLPDPRDRCFEETVPTLPVATGDAGAAPGPPTSGDPGSLGGRGSIDKEDIRAEIRRHVGDVKDCYESRLRFLPQLHGRVVLRFVIASDGTVVRSVVEGTTLADRDVETCVGRQACRWQFPEPTGGGIVIVTYPFSFTPWVPDAGVPPPP